MHSRLLRHFLGVVEKRNITAAAEALNISQPALTRSIRQLETTIGVPLFERLPTGVALTKPGEVLARRVKPSGPVAGKKMVVQATNTGGDLAGNQFDISVCCLCTTLLCECFF